MITQRRKGLLDDKDYFVFQEIVPLSKVLTISPMESTRMLKFGFSLALVGGQQEKYFVETLAEKNTWLYHIIDQVEKSRDARRSLKLLEDQQQKKSRSESLTVAPSFQESPITLKRSYTQPSHKREEEKPESEFPKSENLLESSRAPRIQFSSTGKLGKLIQLFEEANKLHVELFQNPNELRKLLPDYNGTTNTDFHSRIQKLNQHLKQVKNFLFFSSF